MRIYFSRHGESQANILREISNRGLQHSLTARGRQQAAALAQRLQDHPIKKIFSSPLLRALETSIIVANQLGVEYEVTDALREYDCGILEGRSDNIAWQGWQLLFDAWVVHHRWERRIAGGENFYDIRERFVPFIEGLVKQYGETETEVACVSHGGTYCVMLPVILKNVDTALIYKYGFDYTSCVVAENRSTGLYCVEWNGHIIDTPSGNP